MCKATFGLPTLFLAFCRVALTDNCTVPSAVARNHTVDICYDRWHQPWPVWRTERSGGRNVSRG